MFVRQASCRKGGNGIPALRERSLRVSHASEPDVRVHGQLHTQAQTTAREVYDEFRARKLLNTTGKSSQSFLRHEILFSISLAQ